jgi:hypothetical protein
MKDRQIGEQIAMQQASLRCILAHIVFPSENSGIVALLHCFVPVGGDRLVKRWRL